MAVEVEQMRSRMALAEKKAREPSPLLIKLQTKMDAMKVGLCDTRGGAAICPALLAWLIVGMHLIVQIFTTLC